MMEKQALTQDIIDSALIGLSLLHAIHNKNQDLSSMILDTFSDKEIKRALVLAASQLMTQSDIETSDTEFANTLIEKTRKHIGELSLTIGENIE